MFKYLIFIFASQSLFALTILNVTLSTDNNPGGMGDVGDLRYCLNTMNQNLNTSGQDDYAIVFAFPMTIQLNGILPIINNSSYSVNITIGNTGSIPTVTIDGNSGSYSGFFIPMGNVTIQNMIFQNLAARGGNGGDGISGGGGGMGAGGAIYAPQTFLFGSNPSITLINVSITNCSAIGGNGGNYLGPSSTGNEGGGGAGGFSGNGGSIVTTGNTGGGGGGGFGGDGGEVTLSADDLGGGGGGGGGLGSRATMGTLTNLGNGGPDQDVGGTGNGYGIPTPGGSGGGENAGGINLGGGGGGGDGGGGGGSAGLDGHQAQGNIPPGGLAAPSGGNGGDGGGGGGGGVVTSDSTNNFDGQAGSGGYGGGGGGGAGAGSDNHVPVYTIQGGSGGVGGGGGGGGVNLSGTTSAEGGNSLGGGGGGGGGPSDGLTASGGIDLGQLGGGAGGVGDNSVGLGFGGGGGGGGSGLGGAIFVDSRLNFTIQAFSGIPTLFNTPNNSTQAGTHGTGSSGGGATDGFDGSALGNSIFLRSHSFLTFMANDANDLLILGEQVSFIDDASFGGGGTNVYVIGNGTVVYNGTSDYEGTITINNANFKVNGLIDTAPISVCRKISFSPQRGTLSGNGTLTGSVFVNSGTISPEAGSPLTLGSLTLSSADPTFGVLGSLVHIEIDPGNISSSVTVAGPASLAGTLEIDLDPTANPGSYIILTSSAITGTFDFITFTGPTPIYRLSYLPIGSPTFVQFDFLGYPPPPPPPPHPVIPILAPTDLKAKQVKQKCGKKIKIFNILTWDPPTAGPPPSAYRIYRNGIANLIAVIPANKKLKFKEKIHSKKRNYTYSIISEKAGQISYPATIEVKPQHKKTHSCSSS